MRKKAIYIPLNLFYSICDANLHGNLPKAKVY